MKKQKKGARKIIFGGTELVCSKKSLIDSIYTFQPWAYEKIPRFLELQRCHCVSLDPLIPAHASEDKEHFMPSYTDEYKSLDVDTALNIIEVVACELHQTIYIGQAPDMPTPHFPVYTRDQNLFYVDHIYIEHESKDGLFDAFTLCIVQEDSSQKIICLGEFDTPIRHKPVYNPVDKTVFKMEAV